ncbi:hypothetical protein KXD93_16630 [Mucilaginibacter sp. BJC16-A38]|uniref:hypothetical protein n=1 Tax=Mucilaginibacter phenanthrenivorans TaxID=1234842 RepID=UPI002158214A|nr:hypothetical protein [Mucilaginibacter phenanthrenivorans]MCR8559285.1 hypothetical protein [Mucilaginibacter phenanthrenivorans]
MKLKFLEIDTNKSKPKATIHVTGKLGFNMEAIEFMKLENKSSYLLATDEEKSDVFYLLETDNDKKAAKVAKAGNYYYLNVADAFEVMKYDYKTFTIMFDITKDEYEGKDLYVFTKKREIKRKEKSDDIL